MQLLNVLLVIGVIFNAILLQAQNVNIPDPKFKACLVNDNTINTNGDTSIQISEATNFLGTIFCKNDSITDLTGIEDFVNLENLICSRNQLTSIDLSHNTNLKQFICSRNQLTSIDLSHNTNLKYLFLDRNQLKSIDLSQNTNLVYIDCKLNELTSLNIKNGNNNNIITFNSRSNRSLNCIEVDDPNNFTTNQIKVDSFVTLKTNCERTNTTKIKPLLDIATYPNPTNKALTIDFKAMTEKVDIQVRDLRGQLVLSKTVQNTSIVNLEIKGVRGLYFVHIETEKGHMVFKVIKE